MTVLISCFKQLELQLPEVSIPSPAGTTQITDPTECIARVIASLVVLNSIDWPAIVDQLSAIESVLSTDPDSAYGQMNFYTRERYRKAVESLARLAKQSELTVPRQAISIISVQRSSCTSTLCSAVDFKHATRLGLPYWYLGRSGASHWQQHSVMVTKR
jgi:hypothetical protein